jgi:hypothetical protein
LQKINFNNKILSHILFLKKKNHQKKGKKM